MRRRRERKAWNITIFLTSLKTRVNQGNEIGDYITQNLKTQVEPNQITSSK